MDLTEREIGHVAEMTSSS